MLYKFKGNVHKMCFVGFYPVYRNQENASLYLAHIELGWYGYPSVLLDTFFILWFNDFVTGLEPNGPLVIL